MLPGGGRCTSVSHIDSARSVPGNPQSVARGSTRVRGPLTFRAKRRELGVDVRHVRETRCTDASGCRPRSSSLVTISDVSGRPRPTVVAQAPWIAPTCPSSSLAVVAQSLESGPSPWPPNSHQAMGSWLWHLGRLIRSKHRTRSDGVPIRAESKKEKPAKLSLGGLQKSAITYFPA